MRLRMFVLAVGATAALSVPASAGERFHSKVTIHLPPDTSAAYFYGAVRSDKAACDRHRTVKVLRDADGQSGYSPYATGIRSNGDGTWTYNPDPYVINGFYKAIAETKHVRGGLCAKSTSKRFFVD